jgi:hypothetical protein
MRRGQDCAQAKRAVFHRRDGSRMAKETPQLDEDQATHLDAGRIRCPQCGWRPSRHDKWQCSCRHVWNTFDTRGRCPSCGKQWLDTQCPRCTQWSAHEAWYTRE